MCVSLVVLVIVGVVVVAQQVAGGEGAQPAVPGPAELPVRVWYVCVVWYVCACVLYVGVHVC